MSKNQKMLTPAQKRANARNQLFRQIHGYGIKRFVDFAIKENAITHFEKFYLDRIMADLNRLKHCQFENSKELGFNPRRRCSYCNNITHYRAIIIGTDYYLCNRHKEEVESDNKQDINGKWMVTDIHKINPYE